MRDLDDAVDYYTTVLGFAERWRWGEPAVRAGVVRDAVEFQLVCAGSAGAPPGAAVVYCFARDVDAYYAACVARGAMIALPLFDHPFGMRDFRVKDPDGNVIGFGQPIDQMKDGLANVR